jgi:hypothetical protein
MLSRNVFPGYEACHLRAVKQAGVEANGHTYVGVGHAGEQIATAAAPQLFHRALTDIADFARRVS